MTKVKQNVSGYFRTEVYAQANFRVSSDPLTMANSGIIPFIAIHIAGVSTYPRRIPEMLSTSLPENRFGICLSILKDKWSK